RKKGLEPLSLTNLSRDVFCYPLVSRTIHETQRLSDTLIGEDIQERRLLQLGGQPLLQCSIEHGVACRISEVCQDERVFLTQCGTGSRFEVPEDSGGNRNHSNYSERYQRSTPVCLYSIDDVLRA